MQAVRKNKFLKMRDELNEYFQQEIPAKMIETPEEGWFYDYRYFYIGEIIIS